MICPGLPGHQHQQSCQPGIHHGNQQHFMGNNMLNHPHVMSCRLLPFLLCRICAFNCNLKMCAWSNNKIINWCISVYLCLVQTRSVKCALYFYNICICIQWWRDNFFCIFVLNTGILQCLSLSSCRVPAHFFINFQDACLNDRNLEKLSFCSLLMIALCLAGLCT